MTIERDFHKYSPYLDEPGESEWARADDIKQSGVMIRLKDKKYPAGGLPLLVEGDRLYVDHADTHSLIFGTTGSKKTRLFVLPMIGTFIRAGESFVVTDPKGEIYERTSGIAKAAGYKICVLNYRNIGKGDTWNPFEVPARYAKSYDPNLKRLGESMCGDVLQFFKNDRQSREDPFWEQASQSYMSTCLKLLCEVAELPEISLASLARLCDFDRARKMAVLSKFMDPGCLEQILLDPTVNCANRTLRSIMVSTFAKISEMISDNMLLRCLSRSSFDLEKIPFEKTAFYLIIPDEKTTYHRVAAAFVKQYYEVLIRTASEQPNGKLPIRLNFVLDEFCNLPEIPQMNAMISAARSRDIRFYLIAQSWHQLQAKYREDADTIFGNCENIVFLTSRELDLLNLISTLCGKTRDNHPLISVSQLQHFNKELGESLLLCKRNYPFISYMRDIDDYEAFSGHPAVSFKAVPEYNVPVFDLDKYINKMIAGVAKRPFYTGKEIDPFMLQNMWEQYEREVERNRM